MSKVIVIDIDNCWMDSRLWLEKAPVKSKKEEDWDLFYKRVYLCRPNKSFISDVMSLIREANLFPIFVTSRTDKIRKSTIFQIQNNSSLVVNDTCLLYMRDGTEKTYRSSDKIKKEIIKKIMSEHEIVYAIDDVDKNLKMYKEMGVDTVIKYNIETHDYERI